jgi:serine/threonine-protein kinase
MDDATRTAGPVDADGTRTLAPADLLTLTRAADRPPPPADGFRLAAGVLLGGRYQVVAPLGRGGMGEVYRADDLHLGVAVALKFLPAVAAGDPARLDRLRKEVAAARQVSHPHVCRVFDIGEADGHTFLSMEFIPGDDLAGVLRRAGRLRPDVACDLGRQIALGLQAVHDEGLVHRDLKPANVMVDGRGRARLTDFGLAAAGETVTGADTFAGTPAYQAPEQLAGGPITERTDVYALGVLLYELLTGRRPFGATKRAELLRQQQEAQPAKPSELVPGVSPEVDRIVLKCLAFAPTDRPASAYEVWRALPGDAALNAALAAGQTPTAEAVADAGGEGRLSRRVALLLAGWVLVAVGLCTLLKDRQSLIRNTPVRPPAELHQAAHDHLRRFGPADHVADTYGLLYDDLEQWTWWMRHVRTADRLDALRSGRPTPIRYLYRENPVPMQPPMRSRSAAIISSSEPPLGLPGSSLVLVDGLGRLLVVERAVPLGHTPVGGEPDWRPLFAAAGLDPADFRPTKPNWNWLVPHDRHAAWVGVFPVRPDVTLTVEAAADRGEVVGFRQVGPWTRPEEPESATRGRTDPVRTWMWAFVLPAVVGSVGVVLTIGNLRAGRADVRGAIRLLIGFGVAHMTLMLAWLRPVAGSDLYAQVYGSAGRVLLNALLMAVTYLALEPFVRRRWPGRLIGWQRLLAGRLLDPRVGRDVLLGVATGATMCVLVWGTKAIRWPGLPPESPNPDTFAAAYPGPELLSFLLASVDGTLTILFLAFCSRTHSALPGCGGRSS